MNRFEPQPTLLLQQGTLPPPPSVQAPAGTTETGADPAGGTGGPAPSPWGSPLILFGLLFLFMWFFVIRPERRRQKERTAMLGALGKGDEVVTNGGMIGTIARMDERVVVLKVDDNVRLKFDRNSIARVASPKQAKTEDEG
ncbi:MAG TPA: preprotein translocase subunit YajC [Planctomycetota bacterium]